MAGITNTNRVNNTTLRKLESKVVDNVLNTPMYASRVMSMGKKFSGKTHDVTLKVIDSGRAEWFTGLETLNSQAADTTISLSYTHNAMTQPVVSIMLESFANSGAEGEIDLDMFNIEEAEAEAKQELGSAIFGTGAGDKIYGLEALVDDGTNLVTIAGQSRSIYSVLNSTVTASGGTLSLAKLGVLEDAITSAGNATEEPNINVTTKTIWSLYEQLLTPSVRADYVSVGYPSVPVRGNGIVKTVDLKGNGGFTVLAYRGKPVLKDDFATSGVWYMLNERYIGWRGRYEVPSKYKNHLRKVDLGTPKTIEGAASYPSKYNGWFFQEMQMLPNQAGMIGRYYVIGQFCGSNFNRQGKLTGITSV